MTSPLLGGEDIPKDAVRLLMIKAGWHYLAFSKGGEATRGSVTGAWMSGTGPLFALSPEPEDSNAVLVLGESATDLAMVFKISARLPTSAEALAQIGERLWIAVQAEVESKNPEVLRWFEHGVDQIPAQQQDFERVTTFSAESLDLNGDRVPDYLVEVTMGIRHLAAVLIGGAEGLQLLQTHGTFGPVIEANGLLYLTVCYSNPEVGDYPNFVFAVVGDSVALQQ